MSQQEIKIGTQNPNHRKWCLFQTVPFSCHPATPVATGQSLWMRCDAGAASAHTALYFGDDSPSISPPAHSGSRGMGLMLHRDSSGAGAGFCALGGKCIDIYLLHEEGRNRQCLSRKPHSRQ